MNCREVLTEDIVNINKKRERFTLLGAVRGGNDCMLKMGGILLFFFLHPNVLKKEFFFCVCFSKKIEPHRGEGGI